LFEDGRQIRDWVYVGDVVDGIIASIKSEKPIKPVNICTGITVRLGEACEHIANAMGVACTPRITGEHRLGDMRHCLGDPSRFEELIGRKPVSLKFGAQIAFGRILEQRSA
jgi:dTDP-L-rhamnose 4-epimerase